MKYYIILVIYLLQIIGLSLCAFMEIAVLIQGHTPYHHLLIPLVPVFFLITGIILVIFKDWIESNRFANVIAPFAIVLCFVAIMMTHGSISLRTSQVVIFTVEFTALVVLTTFLIKHIRYNAKHKNIDPECE